MTVEAATLSESGRQCVEEGTRQLAAIMFADMVGYTALMQEDEGRAHTQRERQRDALADIVPRHNGEILQHYGDGTLSVFHSAVEAVECAVEIQLEMRREPAVPLRIGVQIGDIVHDRDGVYGDSVNVAARIEALSAPGGVLITSKVLDEIKNHPSLSTVPCGEVRLKNVQQPVRVFAITNDGLNVPTEAQVRAKAGGSATTPTPTTEESAQELDRESRATAGAGEVFLQNIRERALVQWSLFYLATAWALVEIVQFLSRHYAWPSAIPESFALIAFAGFFFALVVTWFHGEKGRQRLRRSEVLIYLALVLATAGALTILPSPSRVGTPTDPGVLTPAAVLDGRSSVAVLPFENLSGDEENAYFASGLHDEVMTQLQRVADLRVISRTSVMEYADQRPNVRVIAANLRVNHVTEGTVQRIGDRLRVHVQLIDAATDAQVWSERYDREVDDAFDVQSNIAEMIADALATTLTEAERGAISRPPTADPEAYRLYLQGRDYLLRPGYRRDNFESAELLYSRAAAVDPEFALVRAELSRVHGLLYWENFDPSPTRLEWQRAEAEEALRLDPDLPQAHRALGWVHYVGGDYARALEEYNIALAGLPNDAEIVASIGYTHRRLGDWPEVFAAFAKATALSPRNANLVYDLGGHSFLATRRYAEAAQAYERAETLAPDLYDAAIHKGHTYVHWQGHLDTLEAVVARLPLDLHLPEIELVRVDFALWSRDATALLGYLEATPGPAFETQIAYLPKSLYTAWAHRLRGDQPAARAAFDSALVSLERLVRENPDDVRLLTSLGYAYAGLGRSQDAADSAERLMGSSQRAGLEMSEAAARILAQASLPDLAISYLETLLEADSPISAQTLRLDPLLDPIRDHPAFESLIERHSGRN
jgi:TolB-like protein/class 3 adenylate cyclase/Flp pilus assembly protein TadD